MAPISELRTEARGMAPAAQNKNDEENNPFSEIAAASADHSTQQQERGSYNRGGSDSLMADGSLRPDKTSSGSAGAPSESSAIPVREGLGIARRNSDDDHVDAVVAESDIETTDTRIQTSNEHDSQRQRRDYYYWGETSVDPPNVETEPEFWLDSPVAAGMKTSAQLLLARGDSTTDFYDELDLPPLIGEPGGSTSAPPSLGGPILDITKVTKLPPNHPVEDATPATSEASSQNHHNLPLQLQDADLLRDNDADNADHTSVPVDHLDNYGDEPVDSEQHLIRALMINSPNRRQTRPQPQASQNWRSLQWSNKNNLGEDASVGIKELPANEELSDTTKHDEGDEKNEGSDPALHGSKYDYDLHWDMVGRGVASSSSLINYIDDNDDDDDNQMHNEKKPESPIAENSSVSRSIFSKSGGAYADTRNAKILSTREKQPPNLTNSSNPLTSSTEASTQKSLPMLPRSPPRRTRPTPVLDSGQGGSHYRAASSRHKPSFPSTDQQEPENGLGSKTSAAGAEAATSRLIDLDDDYDDVRSRWSEDGQNNNDGPFSKSTTRFTGSSATVSSAPPTAPDLQYEMESVNTEGGLSATTNSSNSSNSSTISHRRRGGSSTTTTTATPGSFPPTSSRRGSGRTRTSALPQSHSRDANDTLPFSNIPTSSSSLLTSLDAGMATLRRWIRARTAASATPRVVGPRRQSRAAIRLQRQNDTSSLSSLQLGDEDFFALSQAGSQSRRSEGSSLPLSSISHHSWTSTTRHYHPSYPGQARRPPLVRNSINPYYSSDDGSDGHGFGSGGIFAHYPPPIAEEDESLLPPTRQRAFSEPDGRRSRNFFFNLFLLRSEQANSRSADEDGSTDRDEGRQQNRNNQRQRSFGGLRSRGRRQQQQGASAPGSSANDDAPGRQSTGIGALSPSSGASSSASSGGNRSHHGGASYLSSAAVSSSLFHSPSGNQRGSNSRGRQRRDPFDQLERGGNNVGASSQSSGRGSSAASDTGVELLGRLSSDDADDSLIFGGTEDVDAGNNGGGRDGIADNDDNANPTNESDDPDGNGVANVGSTDEDDERGTAGAELEPEPESEDDIENGDASNNDGDDGGSSAADLERRARARWIRINRRFRVTITFVALIFSLLLFSILVCWVVLTSSYVISIDKRCDVPLKTYFWLATLQLILDVFRTDIMRFVFRWDANSRQRIPTLVIIYNIAYLIYAMLVLRMGINSVFTTRNVTCVRTAPELFQTSRVFISLSLAAWTTIIVGYFGPFCVVAVLLTRNGYNPARDANVGNGGSDGSVNGSAVGIPGVTGVFPSPYGNAGAPSECIEQMRVVLLEEFPTEYPKDCCICMCDFAAGELIVATTCEHVFHKRCFQEWLRHARTCPVCRTDIPTSMGIDDGANSSAGVERSSIPSTSALPTSQQPRPAFEREIRRGEDEQEAQQNGPNQRPNRTSTEFQHEVVNLLRMLRQNENRTRNNNRLDAVTTSSTQGRAVEMTQRNVTRTRRPVERAFQEEN